MLSESHNLENENFSLIRGEFAPLLPPLFLTGCIQVLIHQSSCTVTLQVIFERTLLLSVGHKLKQNKNQWCGGGEFAPPFPPLLFTGCIEVPIHQGNCTVNVGHFRSEFWCRRQATIEGMRGIYRMRGIFAPSPFRHCWPVTAEMLSIIKYLKMLERILKMLGCHNWNNVKISSKSADVCLTHCV